MRMLPNQSPSRNPSSQTGTKWTSYEMKEK